MGTSIDDVIDGARAKFENEAIVMRLTDKKKLKIPAQSTGVPQLDIALGIRGLPKGRIIEIFGPESSGKTTLVLKTIATAQRDGAWAWYGDMEHALDPEWCEKNGVDLDKLLISQPNNGEECLDLAQYMVMTGVIDIIVVDSVSALVPQKELEGESGEAVIGLQARMMSQAMRKLSPRISKTSSIAIFINQIREKIGVKFGSPETTSGGRALKFFSSVRIDIRRTGSYGSDDEKEGNDVLMKIVKNKCAPPFKKCEASIGFDHGFDYGANLLEAGIIKGVFSKSGNTYYHNDIKLGVGKDKSAKYLNELENEKKKELYKEVVGGKSKPVENKEIELTPELKERLAKYEKKLLEADNEEDKKKYQDKIERIKAGESIEDPSEVTK